MNHLANIGIGLLVIGVACLAAWNITGRHQSRDIASIAIAVIEGLVILLLSLGAVGIAWAVGCGVLSNCSLGGSS